jgi:hypothetical protein
LQVEVTEVAREEEDEAVLAIEVDEVVLVIEVDVVEAEVRTQD